MLNAIVDISHHNTITSLSSAYTAGIRGIIHKATQGKTYKDKTYSIRKSPTRSAGMMWGAYHFGTGGSGWDQAKFFLDFVQPDKRTLLVLDYEPNPSGETMNLQQARDFVTHIHNETGVWPGLYCGHLLKEELLNKIDPVLKYCWLWMAHYGVKSPVIQNSWKEFTMWQYTEIGTVPGIGVCDRNIFNGDISQLRKLWNY